MAGIALNFTKLVVRDAEAAERFYTAVGLKVVYRRRGQEEGADADVAQDQRYMCANEDGSGLQVIICEFYKLPPPTPVVYPGQAWLVFTVSDVDATLAATVAAGGRVVKPAENRTEHGVRAAVIADPEGHLTEVVGPMHGARDDAAAAKWGVKA
jgi:catechol 2,3-dioxygenase-like lactoylglutathione lyase family enzyme